MEYWAQNNQKNWVTYITKWVWGILKSLNWVKRRDTTAKREQTLHCMKNSHSLGREKLPMLFSNRAFRMIWSWIRTLIGLTAPNKANFAEKGTAQSVPIGNVDDERQITVTFFVNISCKFLPIQTMYSSVTDRSHSEIKFLGSFHITHSSNHWSNEPIVIDYLKEIIFPYLEKKCKNLKLEKNSKVLLISSVFKRQTTSALNKLLRNNDIVAIHVLYSHKNLF